MDQTTFEQLRSKKANRPELENAILTLNQMMDYPEGRARILSALQQLIS